MNSNIPPRIYGVLLRAYPAKFRREFGPHMSQVFRDCLREQRLQGKQFPLVHMWLHTLLDLIQTAPREHLENFRKENSVMNNLRRDALAVFGCLGIIALAFFILRYGQVNGVPSILMLGYVLDAVVVTGIVGNLVVFLLAKTTKLNPLRTAFWTFLMVNAVPAILLSLIGSRVDPQFNLAGVVIGYVGSFLFWYGLHWLWSQKGREKLTA